MAIKKEVDKMKLNVVKMYRWDEHIFERPDHMETACPSLADLSVSEHHPA